MEENQPSKDDTLEQPLSEQSSKIQSRHSLSSERRAGDSSISGNRRASTRRLSRMSETVTVISSCTKDPDTCVLCGNGIPYSKCICCDNEAHDRCIEAFFCTLGKKVNLESWKCPKCVTLNNMDKPDKPKEEPKASQVHLVEQPTDPVCPFCRIDMGLKNCQCQDCVDSLQKSLAIKKCYCGENERPQMLRYNKCLQYREFGTNIEYKYLYEDDKDDEEEEENNGRCRICWSIAWCLLLVTFAFPIAFICAFIFIIVYCFEACCADCCHPVSCFFLSGIKLPGTCCRGICSGDPMCGGETDCEKC